MEWVGFAGGVVLVLVTGASVLMTLVVPRGGRTRFASAVLMGVRGVLLTVAKLRPQYEWRDRVLVLVGPVSMLAMLGVWVGLFFVGYALVIWPLGGGTFGDALRESGSSIFTLGFATSDKGPATAASLLAAGSGLIVVALQIAYLPTIYDAYSRRETLVTLLDSRAGRPSWGPELLWRHQRVDIVDSLPDLYREWEEWAADLAESHRTYPVIAFLRSPHELRSWVTALLAVLDSAAMYMSVSPQGSPSEARLCLRMGFSALRDIADVLAIPYDPDPMPNAGISLPYEEFEEAVRLVADIGFPVERSAEEAWPDFSGWRVNYEGTAHAIADFLVAPPARWSGPRKHLVEQEMEVRRPPDRRPESPDPD